ncbi:MAG TPA: queuosine precursor transporter [Gammaproteobacteria bacterium]|nr:queuosine precursor transporter [Gammaproteobacteria bacterium]
MQENMSTKELSLHNPLGYLFIVILSMVYMSIMLCNAVLTNRYIGNEEMFVLGGTLTSPFVFILDDIIAEIYGYKMARNVILSGFAAQTVFVLICYLVVTSPYPSFFREKDAYYNILGPSLLRINISGFAAYITANLINSYIITRWKILVKGKYFWLRSVGSSTFAEILYTFLAIILMELNSISLTDILRVASISFIIKLTYSATFAAPANLLVNYIKQKTGIDVYDFPKNLTPFKYKSTLIQG